MEKYAIKKSFSMKTFYPTYLDLLSLKWDQK